MTEQYDRVKMSVPRNQNHIKINNENHVNMTKAIRRPKRRDVSMREWWGLLLGIGSDGDYSPARRLHEEKFILNLVNSNQILVVIADFRQI